MPTQPTKVAIQWKHGCLTGTKSFAAQRLERVLRHDLTTQDPHIEEDGDHADAAK
jgi:hypothetical protein